MAITRKSLADTIDEYDAQIADLQAGKRETYQAYRDELGALMSKDAVKTEIEAFKVALKRRNAIAKKGAETVEEKDALADEIFDEITNANARRAARVEIIEEFGSADVRAPNLTHGGPSGEEGDVDPALLAEPTTESLSVVGRGKSSDLAAATSPAGVEGDADRHPIPNSAPASLSSVDSGGEEANPVLVADPIQPSGNSGEFVHPDAAVEKKPSRESHKLEITGASPVPATNPVANVGEGANGAIAAASDDPASREADAADRQRLAASGFTGDGEHGSHNFGLRVGDHAPNSETHDGEAGLIPATAAAPTVGAIGPVAVAPAAPSSVVAFTPKPFRPHCLNRDVCAGIGRNHCFGCETAFNAKGVEIPHQGSIGA